MSRNEKELWTIVELIEGVEAIPPTGFNTVDIFAGKCFRASKDGLHLKPGQVIKIVDNWPGGCDSGKEAFLAKMKIERVPSILELPWVDFYSFKGDKWYPSDPNSPSFDLIYSFLIDHKGWDMNFVFNPAVSEKTTTRFYMVKINLDILHKVRYQNYPPFFHEFTRSVEFLLEGHNQLGHHHRIRVPLAAAV